MDIIQYLTDRARQTKVGFTDLTQAADEVYLENTPDESGKIATRLFSSDVYQARMIAVLLLGRVSAQRQQFVQYLKNIVSGDANWRVQEMLARAIDRHCQDTGYESALPVIQEWLDDERPNVKRAVAEGLRIWTARPYFKHVPEHAVGMLAPLRADESDSVRRSIGNAIRDISRQHGDVVLRELMKWDQSDDKVAQVYLLASGLLKKHVTSPRR